MARTRTARRTWASGCCGITSHPILQFGTTVLTKKPGSQVRSSPESGHAWTAAVGPFGAKTGSRRSTNCSAPRPCRRSCELRRRTRLESGHERENRGKLFYLIAQPAERRWCWRGYVAHVDALYDRALVTGASQPPRPMMLNTLIDPDGHELSFTRPLLPVSACAWAAPLESRKSTTPTLLEPLESFDAFTNLGRGIHSARPTPRPRDAMILRIPSVTHLRQTQYPKGVPKRSTLSFSTGAIVPAY
jgi:hypothetical protein